jgi:hypothetical protein
MWWAQLLNTVASFLGGGAAAIPTAPVAGYNLWLDAADNASFTFSSGTLVSQWADKSGNGYNFTQATATNQPTRSTTQNSKSTVLFAVNDVLVSTAASSVWKYLSDGTKATVFLVVKNTLTGYNAIISTGDLDSSIVAFNAFTYNKTTMYFDTTKGTSGQEIIATATITSDSWNVFSGYLDQTNATTGDKTKLYLNSGSANSSTGAYSPSTANPQSTLQLGQASTLYNLTGEIAEIITYKSLLSDSDRVNNVNYLKAKWGI